MGARRLGGPGNRRRGIILSRGFSALREAAARTRSGFLGRVATLVRHTELDESTWDEVEEGLITADVGPATTDLLLIRLRDLQRHGAIRDADELRLALQQELVSILEQ